MSSDQRKHILVCGGGNGAHCITAIAAITQPNASLSVLTLYADEAERWTKSLQEKPLKAIRTNNDGSSDEFETVPRIVTKDPSVVVPTADMIFLVVPAFAHEQYLKAIKPYLKDKTVIVGLPARCGFGFQSRSILGENTQTCVIASFETLPWVCRLLEFGSSIEIRATKNTIGASLLLGGTCDLTEPEVISSIQDVFGEYPAIHHIKSDAEIVLMSKSYIHPTVMYGRWGKWDGKALSVKPLFYQGVDELTADYLTKVSAEVVATTREIERRRGIEMKEVVSLIDWYKNSYSEQIEDDSSLIKCLQTNRSYDGLVHPMKETEDGQYVPDFSYRYTSEDIPFGLVVLKGLAEIAGVKTPVIDEVLAWAQGKLGKEFIVGSELKGKDIKETRAPQSYGLKTIDELFKS